MVIVMTPVSMWVRISGMVFEGVVGVFMVINGFGMGSDFGFESGADGALQRLFLEIHQLVAGHQ